MQRKLEIDIHPSEINNHYLLKELVAQLMGLEMQRITGIEIIKRSVDARKRNPVFHLQLLAFIDEEMVSRNIAVPIAGKLKPGSEVFVIGSGPAGMFAAIELLKQGIKPIVIERGKDVRSRRRDLALINRNQGVNENSNYCFGEGGAGTYSDGKLYTRSSKRGNVQQVLETLVHFGADKDILVDAHPHIGTNRLPKIIEAMRNWILENGGEIHFETLLTDVKVVDGKLKSIKTKTQSGDQEFACEKMILATGHSGRNIYELLNQKNILLEYKPFAVGVRVEHSQELIDEMQYHCHGQQLYEARNFLPAASYSWVQQCSDRAAYSFCMCPGGIIAPCATANGEVVTNGWSPSKRNNPFANSGIIAEVKESDLLPFEEHGALRGLRFQQMIEQLAQKQANEGIIAPAQRLQDFTENKLSDTLTDCSYQPGVVSNNLNEWLPKGIGNALREAFIEQGKKMKGYLTNDAIIVGFESRSSSPVRILRDKSYQHPEVKGLFPCGEGAGYAGGIVSAAMDGINCANAVAI